ncbi:hypothetical protein Y888_14080 [Mixta calida B021323]|nr:hypothetical protein Y888_14080 [Mixta calida B021323]
MNPSDSKDGNQVAILRAVEPAETTRCQSAPPQEQLRKSA